MKVGYRKKVLYIADVVVVVVVVVVVEVAVLLQGKNKSVVVVVAVGCCGSVGVGVAVGERVDEMEAEGDGTQKSPPFDPAVVEDEGKEEEVVQKTHVYHHSLYYMEKGFDQNFPVHKGLVVGSETFGTRMKRARGMKNWQR